MGNNITLNEFQKQNAITLVTCTNHFNKVLQFTLVKGITVGVEKRGSKIKYCSLTFVLFYDKYEGGRFWDIFVVCRDRNSAFQGVTRSKFL